MAPPDPPGPPGPPGPDDDPEDTPEPDHAPNLTDALLLLTERLHKSDEPRKERLKARQPDPFSGSDPHKLQPFLLQCQLYFRNNPRAYPDDESKVNFALSYLRDTALQWFEPSILEGTELPWMIDWSEFVRELRTNFGSIDPTGNAEEELDALCMKDNQKILKYNVEFNRLAARVRWGDSALRHRYYKGLPDCIKDILAQSSKHDTLIELKSAAQIIDARYWECNREKSQGDSSSHKSDNKAHDKKKSSSQSQQSASSNTSQSKPTASTSATTSAPKKNNILSKLGKDGKLTPQERKRRMDNSLCMFCGATGHIAKDCAKAAASTKARAAKVAPAAAETAATSSTESSKK